MDKYTIYCTEEQTKKVLDLGAPIDSRWIEKDLNLTAEQMTGWLDEQGLLIVIDKNDNYYTWEVYKNIYLIDMSKTKSIASRKEAILSAIDVALEYLSNNKK